MFPTSDVAFGDGPCAGKSFPVIAGCEKVVVYLTIVSQAGEASRHTSLAFTYAVKDGQATLRADSPNGLMRNG